MGNSAERIQFIRSPRWISYPRAEKALALLDDIFTHPVVHRMPCCLVAAETNNGKTQLLNRFVSKHPSDINPQGEAVRIPVMSILAPPGPDESRLYNYILNAANAPYRLSDAVGKREGQVKVILRQTGLRILVIDDFHNMLAGSSTRQRYVLNVLRNLSTGLRISIALAGTSDAFNALHVDPQMVNRFTPFILPRWTTGKWRNDDERAEDDYLRLLASLEATLPLRLASNLTEDDELPNKLLTLSEGTIGAISALIKAAAITAIASGREKIDLKTLEQTSWVPPSEQRNLLHQMLERKKPVSQPHEAANHAKLHPA